MRQIAELEARLARGRKCDAAGGRLCRQGRCTRRRLCSAARDRSRRSARLSREPLLDDRFGRAAPAGGCDGHHRLARARTAQRPHRTNMRRLDPTLRRGGPQDSWWTGFKRELGTLIEVHPAQPAGGECRRALCARQGCAWRPETWTRPSPRQCGFPGPATRRIGLARRGVTSPRTERSTRSSPQRCSPAPQLPHCAADGRKVAWQGTRTMRVLHVRAQHGFSRALLNIWHDA